MDGRLGKLMSGSEKDIVLLADRIRELEHLVRDVESSHARQKEMADYNWNLMLAVHGLLSGEDRDRDFQVSWCHGCGLFVPFGQWCGDCRVKAPSRQLEASKIFFAWRLIRRHRVTIRVEMLYAVLDKSKKTLGRWLEKARHLEQWEDVINFHTGERAFDWGLEWTGDPWDEIRFSVEFFVHHKWRNQDKRVC